MSSRPRHFSNVFRSAQSCPMTITVASRLPCQRDHGPMWAESWSPPAHTDGFTSPSPHAEQAFRVRTSSSYCLCFVALADVGGRSIMAFSQVLEDRRVIGLDDPLVAEATAGLSAEALGPSLH